MRSDHSPPFLVRRRAFLGDGGFRSSSGKNSMLFLHFADGDFQLLFLLSEILHRILQCILQITEAVDVLLGIVDRHQIVLHSIEMMDCVLNAHGRNRVLRVEGHKGNGGGGSGADRSGHGYNASSRVGVFLGG